MYSAPKHSEFVKTCPFGGSLLLPNEQAWRTLKVFHAYQLVLSAAFFILFATQTGPSIFGQTNSALFQAVSLTYFAFTLFSTVFIRKPYIPYHRQVQFKMIADIIFLTLLMHASGGITSGLGILLAVSVAAGGLLAGGRCTLVFAACATFAVLGEQIYADANNTFSKTAYTYAGILSASFFTIAALALILAKRVEHSEKIAQLQSREIDSLVQLNDYIIKHLQSGIIVIDQHHNVRLTNEAATQLSGSSMAIGTPLSKLSPEYWQLYTRWLRNPLENSANIVAGSNTPKVKLHFSRLDKLDDEGSIIIIDDLSAIEQQVQQGKLASLGRLTASIAHEIRNPLGAISHAEELLSESTAIDKEDRRLLDIIHNHTNRVNSIINSTLQLSRQEESLVETIELQKWLTDFDSRFKEQFGLQTSPIKIHLSEEIKTIQFDSNHLKQIIDNLCSNALKYGQLTDKESVIYLQADRQPMTQKIFISVTDEGNGMSEATAENIFEPFYTTSPSGTGLGLYISNQLAGLNHAKLSYRPNPHGGSCFTLTLNSI